MNDEAGLLSTLTFEPIFKEKIWGGQALKTKLGKNIPDTSAIGESWEISGCGNDQSIVQNGVLKGTSLGDVYANHRPSLIGVDTESSLFPLLYKFIDANDNLSVQVHPDDSQAQLHGWGEYGKTECWYITDAKEDAKIIVGFKEAVTKEMIRDAIRETKLHELLNYIPITTGDVLFIPAGTVHAILDGTLIYEVQETSDTTLRLYDWGRTDSQGNPRALHVDEALSVLEPIAHNQHRIEPVVIEEDNGVRHAFRAVCRYFALEQYTFFRATEKQFPLKKSFSVITVTIGSIQVQSSEGAVDVPKGQSILLPANMQPIRIYASAGTTILLSTIPDIANEIVGLLKEIGLSNEAIALLGGYETRNDVLQYLGLAKKW